MRRPILGLSMSAIALLFLAFQNCGQAPQSLPNEHHYLTPLMLKSTSEAFHPKSQWQLISIEGNQNQNLEAEPVLDLTNDTIFLDLLETIEPEINCLGDCGQKYQLTFTSSCITATGELTNRWVEWEQVEITQIQIKDIQARQLCSQLTTQEKIVNTLKQANDLKIMGNTANDYLYLLSNDIILTFKKSF